MIFNNLFNSPTRHRFWAPTRIINGIDSRLLVLEMLVPQTDTVLVVADVFCDHPFVHELRRFIGNANLHLISVDSEPSYDDVDAAICRLGGHPWKQLLALGGGSVLDLAKALLAHRAFPDYRRLGYGELRNLPDIDGNPQASAIPFIAIPTTAGSGSETNRYFVLVDPVSSLKAVSRSWAICPQVALLDPVFLEQAPEHLLMANAFDAFTHLWETYFCRFEHDVTVRSLAREGMRIILRHLVSLESARQLTPDQLNELQLASAWGGVALSNVRAGLLHTAGEALAAQVDLAHPLTLWVFFQDSLDVFRDSYFAHNDGLFDLLSATLDCASADVLNVLAGLWHSRLEATGNITRIRTVLSAQQVDPDMVVEVCWKDQVLLTKEAPQPLSREALQDFIRSAIGKWGAVHVV